MVLLLRTGQRGGEAEALEACGGSESGPVLLLHGTIPLANTMRDMEWPIKLCGKCIVVDRCVVLDKILHIVVSQQKGERDIRGVGIDLSNSSKQGAFLSLGMPHFLEDVSKFAPRLRRHRLGSVKGGCSSQVRRAQK